MYSEGSFYMGYYHVLIFSITLVIEYMLLRKFFYGKITKTNTKKYVLTLAIMIISLFAINRIGIIDFIFRAPYISVILATIICLIIIKGESINQAKGKSNN